MKINDIKFIKELYPRLKEDNDAIERYRTAIDLLPPIIIARGHILVDGFHRWQAHARENRTEIAAEDLGNLSDAEIFRESIKRNASHGQQLTRKDKEQLAKQLWKRFSHLSAGERTNEIRNLLSVGIATVERWTSDAKEAEKIEQQTKALDMWLSCYSTREIAKEIGIDHATIVRWSGAFLSNDKFAPPPESRKDFDIWNFAKSNGNGDSTFFGKMPEQIVENLLWFFTEPGQIVFDPFAGSGTTIEIAKSMGRRIWASDRKPSNPMLPIHEHNILDGWPKDAPNKVDLILLDPPYWQQAKGRYSDSKEDLANISLEKFREVWQLIVRICGSHLNKTGFLAYIISPTQVDDGLVIDHALEMLPACHAENFQVKRRIIVPYSTQQATGQQIEWAREHKQLLKLYRDLIILSKG